MHISEKIEKLTKNNYDTWSLVVESVLKARNLWKYCIKPETNAEEQKELTDEESVKHEEAKAIMYTAIDRTEILKTGVCERAYELWLKIKENHEGSIDDLNNISLSEFLGFKFRKGESIIEYCGRFENSLAKLESTGAIVQNTTQMWVFKNSLPKDIRTYVNYWILANKTGRVSNLISSLKLNYHETSSSDNTGVALYGKQERDGKHSQETRKPVCSYCRVEGHKWKECRKKKADDKRKKSFAERPRQKTNYRQYNNSQSNNAQNTDNRGNRKNRNEGAFIAQITNHSGTVASQTEQDQRTQMSIGSVRLSRHMNKMNLDKKSSKKTNKDEVKRKTVCHQGNDCRNERQNNEGNRKLVIKLKRTKTDNSERIIKQRRVSDNQSQQNPDGNEYSSTINELALNAVSPDGKDDHQFSPGENWWIVDSGASSHMTPELNNLSDYTEFETPRKITLGNGKPLDCPGQGKLRFRQQKFHGVASEVLYVPDLRENLFSVCKTLNKNYTVNFYSDRVEFVYGNDVYLRGIRAPSGLFALKLIPNIKKELAAVTLDDWHQRFNHTSIDTIKKLARTNAVKGLKISHKSKESCEDCITGKLTKSSHPARTTVKASKDTAVIHIDTCGPIATESLGGSRYFVLAVEEYSGYKLIEFVALKGEIPDVVKRLINRVELESKRAVRMIQTDNGSEFISSKVTEFTSNKGIIHERSAAHTPQQNGLVERGNRTIIDKVRTILAESNMNEDLWAEAANTAVYTDNRIGFGKADGGTKTHYELYWGHKPDVSNLRRFGERAIVLKNDSNRNGKFDVKGQEMVFVGYTDRFNTYRLYNKETASIKITCDCKFPGSKKSGTSVDHEILEDAGTDPEIHILPDHNESNNINSVETRNQESKPAESDDEYSTASSTSQNDDELETEESTIVYKMDENSSTDTNTSSTRSHDERNMLEPRNNELSSRMTRSKINSSQLEKPAGVPIWYWRNDDRSHFTLDDEPMSLEDAMKRDDWPKWKQAMKEEMDALMANHTWRLVNRPLGKRPIKTKWVYTIKLKPDGQIERYKARLVAKGYSQIPNVDYKETFAPVASSTTVRILFALANNFDMDLIQFDVKTAFLNGDLEEELYMEYPQGFEVQGDKICKLEKSLYGLKQAPRQWNKKFHAFLDKFNLKQSAVDKCLYYNDKRSLILTIYVDDGLVASSDVKLSKKLTDELKNTFEVKFMKCESYLGFHVKRDRQAGTLILNQSLYVEKVLEKFGMKEAKPISTPETTDKEIIDTALLTPEYPFKELVGSLLYMVTCTRPDIAHAVSMASRTGQPTMAHWNRLKRILRYLRGTTDLGITFTREKTPRLIGYSDADYAEDVPTRHSTSGYVAFYGQGPIAWRCQLQSIVTLSTTEAELVSAVDLVKDLLPMKETLLEIKGIEDEPTEVRIDNISTVKVVNNPESTKRTKHIDVRYRWINEMTESKKIKPVHIYGAEQAADILTKPLPRVKFEANRTMLAMIMLGILSLMAGSSNGIKLTKVNPLFFRPTENIYIKGDTEYNITVVIRNPCRRLFVDISKGSISVDTQLLKDCYHQYEKLVLQPMEPFAYNKTEYKLHYWNESELIKFSTPDDFPMPGYHPPHLGPEGWGNNNNQGLKRDKRHPIVVPAIMLVTGILVGVGSVGIARLHYETNTKNIRTLADDRNLTRDALNEAANVLDQAIIAIQNMNEWGPDVSTRMYNLGDMSQYFRGMVAARVNFYDRIFLEHSKILNNIAQELSKRKMSRSLLDLANETLWEEPASKFSHLYNATAWIHEDSLYMQLHFSMPIRDNSMTVLEAAPMPFYNETKDLHGNTTVCWNNYSGPKYVLYNITNDCMTDVVTWNHEHEVIRYQTCRNKEEEMKYLGIIWNQDSCTKTTPQIRRRISMYEINGMHRIYCYPFNITIDGIEHQCPDHPFELESRRTFTVMNMYHLGIYLERTLMKDVDFHRSKAIINHLQVNDMKMKVDIGKLVQAQQSFKDKLKEIPQQLKLSSIEWESIKKWNPLSSIAGWFEEIQNYLANLGSLFVVLIGGFVLIALSPVVQLIILLVTVLKIPITMWLRSVRNLTHKIKESTLWNKAHVRVTGRRSNRMDKIV